MLFRAAEIAEMPVLGAVEAMQHALGAARAVQPLRPGLAQGIALRVQMVEKIEHAGRGNLRAFEFIEPDRLAGQTEIEGQFAVRQTRQTERLHRIAADRAGEGGRRGSERSGHGSSVRNVAGIVPVICRRGDCCGEGLLTWHRVGKTMRGFGGGVP